MTKAEATYGIATAQADARYPRVHRLLKPSEFRYVFDSAVRSGDRAFTLLVRSTDQGYPRLGMAIARKKTRTAVGRNRIKRLIRESFRQRRGDLPSIDIVVLLRDGAVHQDNVALRSELDSHWARLIKRFSGL